MKACLVLLSVCCAAFAQNPPQAPPRLPDVPDGTVIATFDDGVSLTAGDFKNIVQMLPPDSQAMAIRDRAAFLKQWALMRRLTRMAEKQGLQEQSPTREKLDYYRMMTLSEAEMLSANNQIAVPPADAKAYYDANHEKYKEVRVKAIYIGFSSDPASGASAPKPRTEEQAKTLAAKLEADLRGGADFVKLVARYSEDAASKAKDGDFATIHGSDNIPDQIRSVVLALKPGEVSEPIRQPTAFYIFRAESVSFKPFDGVSNEIFAQLRQDRYRAWMEQTNRDAKVEIKNPAFFETAPEGKPSGAK